MRYFLVILGLTGSILGLVLLMGRYPWGALWLQIGAGLLAIGLATCDIVAAIERGPERRKSASRWGEFCQAAQSHNIEKMVRMLEEGGVPEGLARRTANDVAEDADRSEDR